MGTHVSEEQKRFFEQEGYLVVKGVYSRAEVEQVNEEYFKFWLDLMASGKIQQDSKRPLESVFPRLRDYHRENETVTKFIIDPRLMEIMEYLLGEPILVIQTSYYFKTPGTRGLPYHQDNYSIGVVPDTTYAAWVSLDPSDQENGGLSFVRKTQQFELLSPKVVPETVSVYGQMIEVPEGYETVEVTTEPGDVVIFNGNILHGSSENFSRHRFRRVLVTHYARESMEKITLNYNYLINKRGERVRKLLNPEPKVLETKNNIFEFRNATYFDQIIKRNEK
ncbi:phytanoyl-CoA dioxygenase family protein [Brevibacillus fulvus]|uniref:Ectoine hydroxylase-related dioxygenase (Phytanoyl-CoA dioxygenase family) n=1 Tax=Brevibacillus fulvus TaxID=1125967 RepID=A0A938XWX8_9BACL|nr:ectoine hydroxylase-related dioxygenase (phytanoyl-CoA dioxygenase family) [Brevibacillus fulvus]